MLLILILIVVSLLILDDIVDLARSIKGPYKLAYGLGIVMDLFVLAILYLLSYFKYKSICFYAMNNKIGLLAVSVYLIRLALIYLIERKNKKNLA